MTGFSEGLALVVKNEKIGFIDKTGNFAIQLPSNLNYYTGFTDGLACVKIDGKFGFIDKSGKIVIRPQFESEAFFSDGLAYVERDGKEGYIDKSGNWVWSKEKEVYDYPVEEDVDEEIDESPAKEK